MADRLLVLGAGGFVGQAVVDAGVQQRLSVAGLVRSTPARPLPDGVTLLPGDVRRRGLGLPPSDAEMLAREVRWMVVSVGRVQLAMSPTTAEREHLSPLRGAIDFARRCPSLERFVFVSSMVAVGDVSGPVRSDYLPPAPRLRNFYEAAKAEGERVVRGSGLPWRIVRPAQVWNAADGSLRTPTAVGLFEVLPLLAAGWILPVNPGLRYWLAPADLVGSVAVAACLDEADWSSVWAVDPTSPTLGELLDVLAFRHGIRSKLLRSTRLARAARSIDPRWLGVDVDRHVLEYGHTEWDLDLRCLVDLADRKVVRLPSSRSYIRDTIDHEVKRRTDLL